MTTLDRIRQHWPQTPKVMSEYEYHANEIPGVGRNEIPALLEAVFSPEQSAIWGVEIGVECGVYSRVLVSGAPRVRLIMVDPWQHYPGYRDHVSQEKLEGFVLEARKVQHDFPGRATIIRRYSVEAAPLHQNETLDFVYIDGNHSIDNVIADLAAWTPKVRRGGLIMGHDYRKPKNNIGHHVVEAVNAWTYAHRITPWFLLGAKGDANRDQNRSFLWVKE
jgi:hypothetical protein